MKLKEGFILRKCAQADIVVPVGENAEKYRNVMVTISGSGWMLWDMLKAGCVREDLVNGLLEKYEVERSVVDHVIDIFITKLRRAELIDD